MLFLVSMPQPMYGQLTALDQLTRLNTFVSGPDKKLVVTLDMDLHKRVLKIEHFIPDIQK